MQEIVIPFMTGDGIGKDITPVMINVVNAAITKAYNNTLKIRWQAIDIGEPALQKYGTLLPQKTLDTIKAHGVAIKGPLATPVGGGIRSLNVALRQQLQLFMCVRPVSYFAGVPSPVKQPDQVDMVIFRENSEDIYTGIEWQAGSTEAKKLIHFLNSELGVTNIQNIDQCAIGVKPISEPASKKIMERAIEYAILHQKNTLTIVHKGNIMKFTEGGFKQWAYQVAEEKFNAALNSNDQYEIEVEHGTITIKDCIADAFLQEIVLHPQAHQVVVTMNLNGDYISDALAAQVGGIGIAPGANLSDECAIFEATHGTAPTIAGKNIANPCSIILSAEMMLRHLKHPEAADCLLNGVKTTLQNKTVTQDFFESIQGGKLLSTSQFGEEIMNNL